jgi:hypothetical protein
MSFGISVTVTKTSECWLLVRLPRLSGQGFQREVDLLHPSFTDLLHDPEVRKCLADFGHTILRLEVGSASVNLDESCRYYMRTKRREERKFRSLSVTKQVLWGNRPFIYIRYLILNIFHFARTLTAETQQYPIKPNETQSYVIPNELINIVFTALTDFPDSD